MPGAGAASRFRLGHARRVAGASRLYAPTLRASCCARSSRLGPDLARAGLARTVLAGSSPQRGADSHRRCNATRAPMTRYCPRQLARSAVALGGALHAPGSAVRRPGRLSCPRQ
eukprot:5440781-Alexandrium_andersonii.AAC.1